MCLFMLYAGLGAAELSYDRSKYQPYAAALASYALVTAVLADATNAIVNVIYDGGSDGAWNQQYVNNQVRHSMSSACVPHLHAKWEREQQI